MTQLLLRQKLQTYLDKVYPSSKIWTPHSIFGQVHIRFELGGDEMFKIYRNGTEFEWWQDRRKMTKVDKINLKLHYQKKALQATTRATTLFYDTFDKSENFLWVIIYEYQSGLFNYTNDFLIKQFSKKYSSNFYDNIDEIETQMITTDQNGVDTFDKVKARVIIGKVKVKDIKAEQILNGISNNELGLEPKISQDIYFLDPNSDRGFYMYDDRGCYVWSDKSEKIKDIYIKRNDWIVDFHRPEIDKYFK